MGQLLLHLIGDYIMQTDWMAKRKAESSSMFPAFAHAVVYSIPFMFLTQSIAALFVICWTHFMIDRFRLARYVVFAKNWITNTNLRWADCSSTGYHKDTPPWLAFWLLIIADNTLHLCINYAAIRWL